MRKNRLKAIVVSIVIIIAIGFAYLNRVAIKDAYEYWTAPTLPAEEAYRLSEETATSTNQPPPAAPGASGSSSPPFPKASTAASPSIATTTASLPKEKLLAVPFMSQAPHANWDMPYQEACEEASALMVRGYYQGVTGRYDPTEADKLILDLVRFQKEHYGFFEDTSATETKRLIEDAFPELTAEVVEMTGPESVMRYIAQGIPVILPADGKALPNPNFRNGGPRYHMLVVRGYTEDRFITNDPGTRKGEKFLYTYDGLLDAVRDWNNGDVPHGRRVMLIVRPKP